MKTEVGTTNNEKHAIAQSDKCQLIMMTTSNGRTGFLQSLSLFSVSNNPRRWIIMSDG